MKRILFDLFLFAGIFLTLFLLPGHSERQGLELFLYKMLLVSAGFLHAHIIRKIAFPYIDFRTSKIAAHKAMVIVLYTIIIFSYARGG